MEEEKKKRGRPKKEVPSETTTEEKTGMSEDTSLDSDSGERDALYTKYEEGYNAETDTSTETGETEEKTDETPSEREESATSTEKEVTTEEKTEAKVDGEGERDKTVPLSALHEEREKRKALSSKVSELESQLYDVLQDYKTRFDQTQKEEIEELDDIGKLQKELGDLKKWKSTTEQKGMQADIAKKRTNLDQQVVSTDATLEKEGYPGFSLAINAVTQELQKRVLADPENAALDKPEGWKIIYKETIYPILEGKFIKRDKEKLTGEKTELKKDALLSGPGVKAEVANKKEEEWTYDDYLQMRFEKQL